MKSRAGGIATEHCGTKDMPLPPSALVESRKDEGSGDAPASMIDCDLELVVVGGRCRWSAPTTEVGIGETHEIEPKQTDRDIIVSSNEAKVTVGQSGVVIST